MQAQMALQTLVCATTHTPIQMARRLSQSFNIKPTDDTKKSAAATTTTTVEQEQQQKILKEYIAQLQSDNVCSFVLWVLLSCVLCRKKRKCQPYWKLPEVN